MTIDINKSSSSDHMELARMIAAQCWCDKETRNINMDARLAEAFAKRLASWMDDAARYCANANYWRDRAESAELALTDEREKVIAGTISEKWLIAKIDECQRHREELREKLRNLFEEETKG